MRKRIHRRFTKRLESEFAVGKTVYRGISSDLSEKGLFIRTRHGAVPGSPIDITIHLPGGKVSTVKGIVKRTVKTRANIVKNGMGIEITEFDHNYTDYIKGIAGR